MVLTGPAVDVALGRRLGWAEGYRAGFTAGAGIGAAGVLLVIQNALPAGLLFDLLPKLPYAGEYQRLRQLRRLDDSPCARSCGACSRCARVAAVAGNLARYGTADYPGGPLTWTIPARTCSTRRAA
jgi:hypothetical protein